jgi:ASC-1-like (ASCH) protein
MTRTETEINKKPELYIKNYFFEKIKSGEKTVELRVLFPTLNLNNLEEGDAMIFNSPGHHSIEVEITRVAKYSSLNEVKDNEDLSKIAPGMTDTKITSAMKQIFKEEKIKQHGIVAIEFQKIEL